MADNQVEDTATQEQEEPKTRRGRPKLDLDCEKIERMAAVGCTKREISYILDIHEDTISRREDVREAYDRGAEYSKVRLRKAMFSNAIDKMNPTTQIFLAKNILGMSDQGSTNVDGDGVLPWSD